MLVTTPRRVVLLHVKRDIGDHELRLEIAVRRHRMDGFSSDNKKQSSVPRSLNIQPLMTKASSYLQEWMLT